MCFLSSICYHRQLLFQRKSPVKLKYKAEHHSKCMECLEMHLAFVFANLPKEFSPKTLIHNKLVFANLQHDMTSPDIIIIYTNPLTEDKQRRYHWISRLLTVCDYLSRDEAQAVLRLEVADSPQIVLASLNLLSALLGCCECNNNLTLPLDISHYTEHEKISL